MKSILYVGASLMIGASIYGFVDYQQTSHKKEFTSMYAEEKKTEPVEVVSAEKKDVITPVTKTEIVAKNKKAVAKKQTIKKEEDFVAIEPIDEKDILLTDVPENIEETTVTIKPSEENTIVKKSKKKKFSTKLFSRAPLRDYDEEEVPAKTKKKN